MKTKNARAGAFGGDRRWAWLLAIMLAGCGDFVPEKETEINEVPATSTHFAPVSIEGLTFVDGGTVFVPVYSHIRVQQGHVALTSNLTIHNTSFQHPIIVTSLRFYDHTGALLKDYLPESHSLEPMGSNSIPDPTTSSRTVLDATIPPPVLASITRDAMLTAIPPMSPSLSSISPV